MKLEHLKPGRSTVELENTEETGLFGEGLGVIRGIMLSFNVMKAQVNKEWPVKKELSDRKLGRVAVRMSDEADRLVRYQELNGVGEYDGSAEDVLGLQNMVADIREHSEPAEPSIAA